MMRRALNFRLTRDETIVILGLFAATCFFGINPDLRIGRYLALCYAFIAGVGILLLKQAPAAGILLIYMSVICAVHCGTPGFMSFSVALYGVALVYLINRKIDKDRIYDTICAVAILNVIWQALQAMNLWVGIKPLFPEDTLLTGLQAQINEASVFLAVCFPAFFRKKWIYLLPVPLAGLIMARSLNGVLAVSAVGSISFIYMCLKRGWRRPAVYAGVLMLLAVGAYALFIDHFSWKNQKEGRLVVWMESIEASLQKPFSGWGFGQYSKIVPLITSPRYMSREHRLLFYKGVEGPGALESLAKKMSKGDLSYFKKKEYPKEIFLEAHNDYIEMLFAAGIPGLFLLLATIGHTMIRGWRKEDRIPFCGFLSSCITAVFFFSWQIVPIAAVTVVWAGFCLRGDES